MSLISEPRIPWLIGSFLFALVLTGSPEAASSANLGKEGPTSVDMLPATVPGAPPSAPSAAPSTADAPGLLPATLHGVRGYIADGQPVIEWQTGSPAATIGF